MSEGQFHSVRLVSSDSLFEYPTLFLTLFFPSLVCSSFSFLLLLFFPLFLSTSDISSVIHWFSLLFLVFPLPSSRCTLAL